MPALSASPLPVTTVILAGGRGVRIGGDKGLQLLQGEPLLNWVLKKVKYASTEVLINANDKLGAYSNFACPVITDELKNWQGPLAGLQAALQSAQTDYVMTVPCDTPFLPDELMMRLFQAMHNQEIDVAVAVADGYRQPTIALYHKPVLPKLIAFLDKGGRKVNAWLDTLHLTEVIFDDAEKFININTREELLLAEEKMNSKP